ncbi:MAG: thiolase domain-containing protein [Candidatus Heimdallarchaeota archaeon]
MPSDVAIVAIGLTKFGKREDVSYRELLGDAVRNAFLDSGELAPHDIEGLYVASAQPEPLVDQAHVANLATEYLGLYPKLVSRIEMACSSGGTAIRHAMIAIKAGMVDTVLCVGAEKMNEMPGIAFRNLCIVPDVTWESSQGMTAPAGFALMAQLHMKKYGTTREQMALVGVKSKKFGSLNEYAHYRNPVTLEDVLNARMIAYPLGLLDCSGISDGAAAVILTRADLAKKYSDTPVWILGSGQSLEPAMISSNMHNLIEWDALRKAAETAYKMASKTPHDIDVAEVHDCFSISEIIETEELGFCKKGEGGKMIEEGQTDLGGTIPLNTSGGLISKGHPIGATGVTQAVDVVKQLRGEADKRQVEGAEVGLTQNLSGFATHHVVHIYSV